MDSKERFRNIHYLLLLAFLLEIFYGSVLALFIDTESLPHKLNQEGIDMMSLMLAGIILAPILEEYVFRFFLKWKYIFLIAMVSVVLLFMTEMWPETGGSFWLIGGVVVFSLCGLVWFVSKNRRWDVMAERSFRKHFMLVFYGQALIFGLVHISNYDVGEMTNLYILPFLVIPQMLLGVILGYSRLMYGQWSNIYLHALHNGILITIVNMSGQLTP